jgi:hypothetical protein
MALDLFEEFKQLAQALDGAGVEHAVVGALAVAIYGAPRATTDIDLLIERSTLPNAIAVAKTLGFGVLALPMTFRDGTEVQRITKLAGAETLTLDFLLVNTSLEPAWHSRLRLETDFGPLTVISREALIAMKVASGRPRDLGDVESLEEMDR